METLGDLTTLSSFAGTGVPDAALQGPCLQMFGPMLTHPNRVTFPWPPLRQALFDYFSPPPGSTNLEFELDPSLISGGWAGLQLVLTSFKRLEVVESEEETKEVLAWLSALKLATIKRSISLESSGDGVLQQVLANLLEPVPNIEDLYATHSNNPSLSPEPTRGTRSRVGEPANKKRKSNASVKVKENNATNNALSGYADFPELPELDAQALSGLDSEEDGSRGGKRGAYGKANVKVQALARQLNEATGMALNRCVESISAMPQDELDSMSLSGGLPAQLLDATGAVPAAAGVNGAAAKAGGGAKPKKAATPRPSVEGAATATDTPPAKKVTRIQRPHDPNRPNFSYSALIGQAILQHPEKKMRLGEIYDYVTANYPYYKKNECGWQNSIRHNLSLQPVFRKIPDLSIPGKKGCFWMIIESEEWRFEGGGWKKIEKGDMVPSRDGGPPILVGPGVQVKVSAKKAAARKRELEELERQRGEMDDSFQMEDGSEGHAVPYSDDEE